ncbi:MAG: vWA domain-containing protein, partial [Solirubrobacteraceae bacterium]
FPNRTLVLVPAPGAMLSAGRVHVSENGKRVPRATVTKVSAARAGSLGVMLVVDVSEAMRGTGLNAALAAGRQLATARFPGELIGLVRAGAKATVALAPTADGAALQRALSGLSASGTEGDSPAGVSVALAQLHAAKVALGAIVVITDGAGLRHATATSLPSRPSLVKAAGASHTSVVTIGVRDAASAPSTLEALRRSLPGQFTATAPTAVPGVVGAVQNSLGDDYLVSYRSTLPAGRPVAVTANVHGLQGTVSTSYQAPVPTGSTPASGNAGPASGHSAPASGHATPGHAASGHAGLVPSLDHSTPLSPKPGFETTAPAQTSTRAPTTSAQPAAPTAAAPVSFWSGPRASVVAAGGAGLLVMLALWAILYRPSRRTVRVRIESFIPTETPEPDLEKVAPVRRGGPLSRLQRGSWWPPFVENVEIARMRQAPIELVKRAAVLAVVVAVLLGLLSGEPLLAVVPILAWPFALRSFVKRAVTKQRNKFGDSLPSYLHDLASSIRVGRSFVGALAVVGESADVESI